MKRWIILFAILSVNPAAATEQAKEPAQGHRALMSMPAAFEHLKALAGQWQGVGKGMENSTTSFEIVANGSAIMECSPLAARARWSTCTTPTATPS